MSNTPQNTLQSDLQPIPARKPRKSIKPTSVQAAILARSAMGETKTQIANDLGISRTTVHTILSSSEIEREVILGRSRVVQLIPNSIDVIEKKIEKGSETAALAILRGTQVLNNQPATVNQTNVQANTWIQMLTAKRTEEQVLDGNGQLHQDRADASTNSIAQIADIVDSKQDK